MTDFENGAEAGISESGENIPVAAAEDAAAEESKSGETGEQNVALTQQPEAETGKKKSKYRKAFLYFGFVLINVAAVLAVLLLENKSGDMVAGKEAMKILGHNWIFTALALFIFVIQISCDTAALSAIIKETGEKKHFSLSFRTALIGKYYDKLTPWSTGGQPMQMAYLATHGMDTPTGCSVPLSRSIIKVFAVGSAAIIILTAGGITVSINVYIMVAAYISVAGTLFFPFFFMLFMRRPQWGEKVTSWIIKLLVKMKLVKDYDKTYARYSAMVNDFLGGMKYLSAHKKIIAVVAVATLIDLFATNMIPFFIIKAFGIRGTQFWELLVMCFFVTYASYFAPSPGSAGVAELSFYAIFAAVITDRYLFWALLFWRVIMYYIPILTGGALQVYEGVKSLVKRRKSINGSNQNPA